LGKKHLFYLNTIGQGRVLLQLSLMPKYSLERMFDMLFELDLVYRWLKN